MADTPLVHLNAKEAAIARANGRVVYTQTQELSTLDWATPVTGPVTAPPVVKGQGFMIVMFENQSYADLVANAPYLSSLKPSATNYFGDSHPSLPNYLALTTGQHQLVSDDNAPSSHTNLVGTPNLFSQMDTAGLSWSAWFESLSGDPKVDNGSYAVRHNPLAYVGTASQVAKCQPYTQAAFVAHLDSCPSNEFVWLTPNVIDDMHDAASKVQAIQDGDAWAKATIPAIQATNWYKNGGTILVVFDEAADINGNDLPGGFNGVNGGPVSFFAVSQTLSGKPDFTADLTHVGLLQSIEKINGLPILGGSGYGDISAELSGSTVTTPVPSATLLGMYSGGSASQGASDSATYLHKTPREIQIEFLDPRQAWSAGMASSWYINNLDGAVKGIMSVPMLVGPTVGTPGSSGTGQSTSPQNPSGATTPTLMTLADVGAGKWDALYTEVFKTIASVRPDCILRIGWEMYGTGGFFNWSGPALMADHKAAFIDLVKCARAVSSKFQFDWNGAGACNGYDPITAGAYPGDEYVDFITGDVYQNWENTGAGAAGWANLVSLIQPGFDFAKAHNKPWGIPEYGLWGTGSGGSGDDPAWLQASYDWLKANEASIGYILYFNNPGSSMSLQQCPNSAAVFEQTFGTWA